MDEHTKSTGNIRRRFFVVILAVSLVFAFGLHDVQLEHVHHHGGESHHEKTAAGVTEYLHAMDRKLVMVIISVFALCMLHLTRILETLRRLHLKEVQRPGATTEELGRAPRLFDFTTHLFGRGILHPRVYS